MQIPLLLNISTSRPSHISFFSKTFFDQLYQRFRRNVNFWDNYWLDLYTNKYTEFEKKVHEEFNFPLDKIKNNVPTLIVDDWRYNLTLIDYIDQLDNKNIINGDFDKIVIKKLDTNDYEYHDIIHESNNYEIINIQIDLYDIIHDLKRLIDSRIHKDDIDFFFRLYGANKYTLQYIKNPDDEVEPDVY
jgi:hypothetical protein